MSKKELLYTLRWLINNKWGQLEHKDQANKIVTEIIGDKEDRPSAGAPNSKKLWCPFAELDFPKAVM